MHIPVDRGATDNKGENEIERRAVPDGKEVNQCGKELKWAGDSGPLDKHSLAKCACLKSGLAPPVRLLLETQIIQC